MAVTITAAELAAAIRVGDSTEEQAEVARLLASATEAVTRHAPNAPDVAHSEACVRLVGHWFDQPLAGRGAYADAMRNSGALQILLPYRVHRAGSTAPAADETPAADALLLLGTEVVVVTAPQTWGPTALPRPRGAVAGISVDGGEIRLFRVALLSGAAVVGDPTGLTEPYAVDTAASGAVVFAAAVMGTYTVRIYAGP